MQLRPQHSPPATLCGHVSPEPSLRDAGRRLSWLNIIFRIRKTYGSTASNSWHAPVPNTFARKIQLIQVAASADQLGGNNYRKRGDRKANNHVFSCFLHSSSNPLISSESFGGEVRSSLCQSSQARPGQIRPSQISGSSELGASKGIKNIIVMLCIYINIYMCVYICMCIYIYMRLCIYIYICVCVCVCVHNVIYIYIRVYIYIYICVCGCVCVHICHR